MLFLITDMPFRRYLANVTVEHKNWRTEKRPKDDTDSWARDGKNYRDPDKLVIESMRNSGEFRKISERILETYGGNSGE